MSFTLVAVKLNEMELSHAAPKYKADRDIVLEAVKQNGYLLDYAARELKKDSKFMFKAVRQKGSLVQPACGARAQGRQHRARSCETEWIFRSPCGARAQGG